MAQASEDKLVEVIPQVGNALIMDASVTPTCHIKTQAQLLKATQKGNAGQADRCRGLQVVPKSHHGHVSLGIDDTSSKLVQRGLPMH